MKAVLKKTGRAFFKAVAQNAILCPATVFAITWWSMESFSVLINTVVDNIEYLGLWAAEARYHWRWQMESRHAGWA